MGLPRAKTASLFSSGEAAIDSAFLTLYSTPSVSLGCNRSTLSRNYLLACSREMPGDVRDGAAASGGSIDPANTTAPAGRMISCQAEPVHRKGGASYSLSRDTPERQDPRQAVEETTPRPAPSRTVSRDTRRPGMIPGSRSASSHHPTASACASRRICAEVRALRYQNAVSTLLQVQRGICSLTLRP
jgi:hypothetical protein